MSNTSFPDSAIVYILADIPGEGELQGSGVIIGPHTILTAAHLLYDAGANVTADAVSLYPGFTPDTVTYNPEGALGGYQSIHRIKVADRGDDLSADASQSDFAIIDTSADLSAYGSFALDPSFNAGDVVVKGYPQSNNGYLAGTGGVVGQDGTRSLIGTAALPLSPGYSGGPLYDTVERNGNVLDAVVGTVSTSHDAMKLTTAKVALIRHWIASDRSLYAGGRNAPAGLVPQIDGTVGTTGYAAHVTAPSGSAALAAALAPTSTDTAPAAGHGRTRHGGGHPHPAVPAAFLDFVNALQRPAGGQADPRGPTTAVGPAGLAAPDHRPHGHGRLFGDA